MRNLNFYKKILTLIILMVMTGLSFANNINEVVIRSTGRIIPEIMAKSGSAKDIQEAVDLAASLGFGIVRIPEGTFNFVEVGEPWKTVVIPAGISIFGAPTERYENGSVKEWKTVLVMPWDVPGNDSVGIPIWFKIIGNRDPNKSSRFSDIKLIGYRDFNPNSTSMHHALYIESVINFRVSHCYFKHTAAGIFITSSCGVIDHCFLVNDYGWGIPYEKRSVGYGVHVHRDPYCNVWDNFQDIAGKYLNYTVFIEDCYFKRWRHCVVGNKGAHIVFRHNIIQYGLKIGEVDMHEIYQQNYVGGRAYECYENQIIDPVQGEGYEYAFLIRNGAGVFFNNTVDSNYGYFMFTYNAGVHPQCYPRDIYIWGNKYYGPRLIGGSPPLREGKEYFLYKPDWYTPYPYPHPLTLRE